MKYKNPIIPGFYPDPSICRVGEDYYLVNSSFEYFPGVPLFHSRDLVNWKQIGHCLTRESQVPLRGTKCSDGIYAPTLRYHQGRFYMATTNMIPGRGFCNFFVHTDDPAGYWSEPVFVAQGGIDPSLFFDNDGKVYWTGNGTLWAPNRGIYQSEIDIATGKLLTDTKYIWPGTGGSYPESPHLFKRGDYYYLSIAEGGTAECHMVTVARSKTPFGSFEPCPHNPVLTHRSLMNPIQATGHADFIEDHHGDWWVVFLGIRYADFGFHNLGRETYLAPVEWTPDGWPVVNGGQKVNLEMNVSRVMSVGTNSQPPIRDDFKTNTPAYSWIFLRNPNPQDWSLTDRPGSLRLRCSPVTLNDLESPALLARRQQHFDCRVETEIDFTPQHEYEEAGIALMMDNDHHVEFVVTLRHNLPVAMVRCRVGPMVSEVASAPLPSGPIQLRIDTNRRQYRFSVLVPGDKPQLVGHHPLRYLSTEVAGGYVGIVMGLYASSNGKASTNQAYFDWFDYQDMESA